MLEPLKTKENQKLSQLSESFVNGADNRTPAASPAARAPGPSPSSFRPASAIGCSNVHRTFSLTPMPSQVRVLIYSMIIKKTLIRGPS